MSISGSILTDIAILSYLSIPDFRHACQINKFVYNLSKKEFHCNELYKMRFERCFSNIISKFNYTESRSLLFSEQIARTKIDYSFIDKLNSLLLNKQPLIDSELLMTEQKDSFRIQNWKEIYNAFVTIYNYLPNKFRKEDSKFNLHIMCKQLNIYIRNSYNFYMSERVRNNFFSISKSSKYSNNNIDTVFDDGKFLLNPYLFKFFVIINSLMTLKSDHLNYDYLNTYNIHLFDKGILPMISRFSQTSYSVPMLLFSIHYIVSYYRPTNIHDNIFKILCNTSAYVRDIVDYNTIYQYATSRIKTIDVEDKIRLIEISITNANIEIYLYLKEMNKLEPREKDYLIKEGITNLIINPTLIEAEKIENLNNFIELFEDYEVPKNYAFDQMYSNITLSIIEWLYSHGFSIRRNVLSSFVDKNDYSTIKILQQEPYHIYPSFDLCRNKKKYSEYMQSILKCTEVELDSSIDVQQILDDQELHECTYVRDVERKLNRQFKNYEDFRKQLNDDTSVSRAYSEAQHDAVLYNERYIVRATREIHDIDSKPIKEESDTSSEDDDNNEEDDDNSDTSSEDEYSEDEE